MVGTIHSGGELVMRYMNATDSHVVRANVLPFDNTTWLYTGNGWWSPTETGLVETFLAFGAIWQLYYSPDWTLFLESVWQYNSGSETSSMLSGLPPVPSVSGAASVAPIPRPTLRRVFTITSPMNHFQRLWLKDIATNEIGKARYVSATTGGFDNRDRMLIAYLSDRATGLCIYDGYPIQNNAKVRVHMDTQPAGESFTLSDTLPAGVLVSG